MANNSEARKFFDMVSFYCKHVNDMNLLKTDREKEFMREICEWKFTQIDSYVKRVQLQLLRMGEEPSDWNIDEAIKQAQRHLDALLKEKELLTKKHKENEEGKTND